MSPFSALPMVLAATENLVVARPFIDLVGPFLIFSSKLDKNSGSLFKSCLHFLLS
uniref:Uncharacterized protein n=1 Tax=Lepeophtheirus salmonis TaxID=72036 RepID=A0A0K2UTC8_LEPSM